MRKKHPTTDPLAKFMVLDIAKQADVESKKLLQFIRPLYRVTAGGRPEQFGTGTLIRIGERRFLVTAAHVLDGNRNSTLYIAGNKSGELEALAGPSFRTAEGESRDNDLIDIGAVEIRGELLESFHDESFASVDMIDPDDRGSAGAVYIAMGYPASKHKIPRSNAEKIKLHPISYTANILPDDELKKLGLSTASHLLLSFDKKDTRDSGDRRITPPDPFGMSGGPLWRFDIYGDSHITSKLVGTLIQWEKKAKAMLATRVPALFAGIGHEYEDSRELVPLTKSVQIQVTRDDPQD